MRVTPTSLPDVLMIEPRVFDDPRGFFFESYNRRAFTEAGIDAEFVQDNHSRSVRGVLRGLHYQIEHAQGKLVRVIAGCVFDVAVDLRRSSPTFGRHVAVSLSGAERRMLYVPPGFAHGFLVLCESADFLYRCTEFYAPAFERAIQWNDPDLKVEWPMPEGVAPVLSAKDAVAPRFRDAEYFA